MIDFVNLELCPLLQDLSSFPLPALTFLSHFLQETLVNLINNIKKNRTTADGESFRHTNLKKKKKHCKVTVKTMKNSYKLSVSVFKKPDLNYKTNIN